VIAAHLVIQAKHIRSRPQPRRRIPQPWQSLAQQRLHGSGEESASQLCSAQIAIDHHASPSDLRWQQPPISAPSAGYGHLQRTA
jgi:hypothetical protein